MDDAMWKQTWGEALNQQQAAAVQAADGPVLLLAVPGSGKTTVLDPPPGLSDGLPGDSPGSGFSQ